jgi:CBS domain containing-hemolysin-like protein
MLGTIMLSVVVLIADTMSTVMLSSVTLSIVVLSADTMSTVMLNVIMLRVVGPFQPNPIFMNNGKGLLAWLGPVRRGVITSLKILDLGKSICQGLTLPLNARK